MSLKDEVEVDILAFFDKIDILGSNTRKEILRELLTKYARLSTEELLLDSQDLMKIVDDARQIFSNKTMPIFLGKLKKRVSETDQVNLCMIESTIMFLNSRDSLKRSPKFDVRSNKF